MQFKNIFILINFLTIALFSQNFDVSTTSQFRQALKKAGQNGENDVIILEKGVYKTSDDGLGTFLYATDEDYNLTIKSTDSLNRSDVILDGDKKDLVLKIHNLQDNIPTTVRLEKFTVQNGKGNVYFIVDEYAYVSNLYIDKLNIIYSSSKGLYSEASEDNIKDTNISYNKYKAIESIAYKLIIENSIISHNDSIGIDSLRTLFLINSEVSYNKGKGIFSTSKVIIKDSNITNQRNGGVYANHLSLENCIISNNSTFGTGGGIDASSFLIKNSKINSNYAKKGGGIYAWYNGADYIIVNSEIKNNTATEDGGGIYVDDTKLFLITNSIIQNNRANEKGGAIFSSEKINVINNTFINNTASYGDTIYGGGTFINNIFCNEDSGEMYFTIPSTFYNNLINFISFEMGGHENITKKNNLDASYVRVDFAEDGEHVLYDSKTIDSGLNFDNELFEKLYSLEEYNKILDYLQTDKVGNFRKANEKVDIGAYEYNSTKPSSKDDFFNPSDYHYWHLVSLPGSIREDIANIYKYQILITWTYKNGKWYMASPKPSYKNLKIDKIKYPDNKLGYWIKTKTKSTDFITLGNYDYRYNISLDSMKSGWHLICSDEYNTTKKFNDIRVKSIWAYKNGKWKLYLPEVLNKDFIYKDIGVEKLTYIDKKDGYWIYKAKPNSDFIVSPNRTYFYLGEKITFKPISPYIKYAFWKIDADNNTYEDSYRNNTLEVRFKKAKTYIVKLSIIDSAEEESNTTKYIVILDKIKKPNLSKVLATPFKVQNDDKTEINTFSRLSNNIILYNYNYNKYNSVLDTNATFEESMHLDEYKYGYKGVVSLSTPYTVLKTSKDGVYYEISIRKYYDYKDINLVEHKVYEKGLILVETTIKKNQSTIHYYKIYTNTNNNGIEVSENTFQDYINNFQSYINNLIITEDNNYDSALNKLLKFLEDGS